MAFWQWLRGVEDHVRDSLPTRALIRNSDIVSPIPIRQEDPSVQLFCISLDPASGCGEERAYQVLRGVTLKREQSLLDLKKQICLVNPEFSARQRHDRLQLRFPTLKVERPYGSTLLKHVEGLHDGTVVICSWTPAEVRGALPKLRPGSARSEQDHLQDDQLAALFREGCIFPVVLKFELEQTRARVGLGGQPCSSLHHILVDGNFTVSDLSAIAWTNFETECCHEMRHGHWRLACGTSSPSGPTSCKEKPNLNFYLDSTELLWQQLEQGTPLSGIINLDAIRIAKATDTLEQVLQRINELMCTDSLLRVLCGMYDGLYYEAENYAIGPWGREVGNVYLGPAKSLPSLPSASHRPNLSTAEQPALIVRTLSGQVVLELSREEAVLLTAQALKERIREVVGWAIYRQQLSTSIGHTLCDEDLLPLNAQGSSELTVVLSAGHAAAVELVGVYFSRTKHEHEGKPIYHGHQPTGFPCEVLWMPRGEAQLRRGSWVLRPLGDEREVNLGTAETLAEITGARLLRLDGSSSSVAGARYLNGALCCSADTDESFADAVESEASEELLAALLAVSEQPLAAGLVRAH